MEVPRLEVEWEQDLQLLVYTTATAIPDPSHVCSLSHICELHHSLRQCWILDPLSEAKDRTHILINISHILNLLSQNGKSWVFLLLLLLFLFFFLGTTMPSIIWRRS